MVEKAQLLSGHRDTRRHTQCLPDGHRVEHVVPVHAPVLSTVLLARVDGQATPPDVLDLVVAFDVLPLPSEENDGVLSFFCHLLFLFIAWSLLC